MSELNSNFYQKKIENPKETVYEITAGQGNPDWGVAFADIVESELHYHQKMTEVYVVLEGDLDISLDGKTQTFHPGEVCTIRPGVKHKAITSNPDQQPSRILVATFPEWSPKDHFLLESLDEV